MFVQQVDCIVVDFVVVVVWVMQNVVVLVFGQFGQCGQFVVDIGGQQQFVCSLGFVIGGMDGEVIGGV